MTAFFPAFILISIYLINLVFVSSGLSFSSVQAPLREHISVAGSSSRSVHEWHVLGGVFTWLCSMTSLRLNPKAQCFSLHF